MTHHLKELQSWMYNVITDADSLDAGAEKATIDDVTWNVDTIVAPSEQMNSYERMSIYRNGYFLRLLECFKNEYKGLLNALGRELFDHLAWSYLQAYPSTSYTLNELGKMFPQYLQQSLEDSLNGDDPDWWQLFIIDMANYERTFIEVFNGLGIEKLEANIYEKPSPALRTLQLDFPIDDCLGNFRNNQTDVFPDKESVNYIFYRSKYRVVVHKASDREFAALLNWMENPSEPCPEAYRSDWNYKGICF